MNRRTFLGVAAGLTLADAGAQTPPSIPIIDTHIHLFDTERPGGVPWPSKNNPAHKVMYMPSLPSRYRKVVDGLGIVGAIEIECSPLLEDNQWVLDVARDDDIMVGTIGHLTPGTPEFRPNLERFHKNQLFRGIRYGLGGRAGEQVDRPEFVADLKALADADLVMDTANPSVSLLEGVVRVSDRVPNLRIVIDHLPQMLRPTEAAAQASYDASMKAIHGRPQIYVKVSEVLRRVDDKIPIDLAFYRPRIDEIVDVFGMDRVLYGSDWPNGDQWLPVPVGFKIVHEYFMGKGQAAAEKYFWRNSIKAYKWVKRNASQRQA
jgi:predicted TIM-barrel fold metal-dependent hydrolase